MYRGTRSNSLGELNEEKEIDNDKRETKVAKLSSTLSLLDTIAVTFILDEAKGDIEKATELCFQRSQGIDTVDGNIIRTDEHIEIEVR